MNATMFDRDADTDGTSALPSPPRRSRRLSLPSTMPSSLRRRSRLPPLASSSAGTEGVEADQALPHIPFASPPYMPVFGASSSASAPSLVAPPSKPKADVRRSMPVPLPTSSAAPSPSSRIASPTRPRHARTESSRFRQRLSRWATSGSRDKLDFGCAGSSDWLEGPQDMGDVYYSPYPGNVKRDSTSSVETPVGGWTHARGESTSSTLSATSTAASSLPNSPVLRTCAKFRSSPPTASPSLSSAMSSTRSLQRKVEEDAALEAVNDHFRRVRLSQIEQHRRHALNQFTFPQRPAVSYEAPHCTSAEKQSHRRSPSDELEIEFLESGHSTFTPLDAHLSDDGDESIYISYDDLSDTSTFSPADVTPVPRMTFDAIPEADETTTSSASSSARPSLTEATVLAPGVEEDLVPALEELSDYFVSTLVSEDSSASSTAVNTPLEWTPVPILPLSHARRRAAAMSAPDLSAFAFPPKEVRPLPASASAPAFSHQRQHQHQHQYQHHHHHRGSSTASLPCVQTPRSPGLGSSRHKRGGSASFLAAQRTRLVAAGRVKPTLAERHLLKEHNSLYDWI
ncbi:hypothetical protein JCM3774_002209 [Rhodotorula dairenensis]